MKFIFVSEEFLHLRSWKDNQIPVEICKSTARRVTECLVDCEISLSRAVEPFSAGVIAFTQYYTCIINIEEKLLLEKLRYFSILSYNILLQYRHTRRLTVLSCIPNVERTFVLVSSKLN